MGVLLGSDWWPNVFFCGPWADLPVLHVQWQSRHPGLEIWEHAHQGMDIILCYHLREGESNETCQEITDITEEGEEEKKKKKSVVQPKRRLKQSFML